MSLSSPESIAEYVKDFHSSAIWHNPAYVAIEYDGAGLWTIRMNTAD